MKNKKTEMYRDERGNPKGYRVGVADNAYGVCPFCGNSYSEQDIQDGKVNFEHMFSRFAVKDAIGSKKTFSKIESDFMVAVHKDCNTDSGKGLEEQISKIIANLNKPGATLLPKDAITLFNYCIKISVFLRYLTDYENIPKGFCYNNEKIDSEHSDKSDFYKDFNIRLRYVDSSSGLWWYLKESYYKESYYYLSHLLNGDEKHCFTAVINGVEISFYHAKYEEFYQDLDGKAIFIKKRKSIFLYHTPSDSSLKDKTQWCLEKIKLKKHNKLHYRLHLRTLLSARLELNKNYFSRQKKLSEIVKLPPEKQKQFMDHNDNGIVFYHDEKIYYVDNGDIKNISELSNGTEIPAVYLNKYTGSELPEMMHLKINGDFIVVNSMLNSLEEVPRKVGGNFICSNTQLVTLRGVPKTLKGKFNCSHNHLYSLEYAPQGVTSFNCSYNHLDSLEYAPQNTVITFKCSHNLLTSLEGAPQSVVRDFDCSDNLLGSLEGAPQSVGRDFDCSWNRLYSLEDAPQLVGGDFNCSWNNLYSLDGAPESVGGDFDCFGNKLTSLKHAPQSVGGDFVCYENELTSLEGAPKKVGGDFNCCENELTSLENAPQSVGGNFYCITNALTSLAGAPKKVGGSFYCNCNKLTSFDCPDTIIQGELHFDVEYLKSLNGLPHASTYEVGDEDCHKKFSTADELRTWFAEYKKGRELQAAAKKLKSANTAHDIKKQIVPDNQNGM